MTKKKLTELEERITAVEQEFRSFRRANQRLMRRVIDEAYYYSTKEKRWVKIPEVKR